MDEQSTSLRPVVDVLWDHGYDAAVLLREIVRARTGSDPGPIHHLCPTCGSITHGRPSFDGVGWVSIARSGSLVVVAFSSDVPVGIDVAVTDGEAAAWTRLEALAKARGTGIVEGHDPAAPDAWVDRITLVPGFTAALAVLGLSGPPEVRAGRRSRASR